MIVGLWTRCAAVALTLHVARPTTVEHRLWKFAPPQRFGQMVQLSESP